VLESTIQDSYDEQGNKRNIELLTRFEDDGIDIDNNGTSSDSTNDVQSLSGKIKKGRVDKGKKRVDPYKDESDNDIERLVKNEQDDNLDVFDFESRIPREVFKVMKTVGISESVDTVSKKLTAEKKKRPRKKKKRTA
jgi:hypothetical protein